MNKPYIVCYMMNSLDGRIKGDYFGGNRGPAYRGLYADLHMKQVKKAWMSGTATLMTLQDMVGRGPVELPENVPPVERIDFVADANADIYAVAIDALGELNWPCNTIQKGYNDLDTGRYGNHIIEIVTDQVSDAFLAHLQKMGISYIFAGKDDIDYTLAMEKLYNLFGIDHLLLEGGAYVNGCLMTQNQELVDEYSVLMMATIDAGPQTVVTSFTPPANLPKITPVDFYVKDIQVMEGNSGMWMRFVRNEEA